MSVSTSTSWLPCRTNSRARSAIARGCEAAVHAFRSSKPSPTHGGTQGRACHAEAGRLLHDKAHLGELERLNDVNGRARRTPNTTRARRSLSTLCVWIAARRPLASNHQRLPPSSAQPTPRRDPRPRRFGAVPPRVDSTCSLTHGSASRNSLCFSQRRRCYARYQANVCRLVGPAPDGAVEVGDRGRCSPRSTR